MERVDELKQMIRECLPETSDKLIEKLDKSDVSLPVGKMERELKPLYLKTVGTKLDLITVVVLDGFHKGYVTQSVGYAPILRLAKPTEPTVANYGDRDTALYIEYKECFRAVDKKVILYSESGESTELIGWFLSNLEGRK